MRAIVGQVVTGDSQEEAEDTQAVISALQQRGILSDLIDKLTVGGAPQLEPGPSVGLASTVPSLPTVLGSEQHLLIHLLGGKAFVGINRQGPEGTEGDTLVVHVQMGSVRWRSKAVPYSVDPPFEGSCLLPLPGPATPSGRAKDLLHTKQLIHIVVVREASGDGNAEVLGSHLLEWRRVLVAPADQASASVSVELSSVGALALLPAGIVDIRLELLPPLGAAGQGRAPSTAELEQQLQRERTAEGEAERLFFAHARGWWQDFLAQRPSHKDRIVKIFAMTDFGVQRPVVTFVRPLPADRLLESASHAARFVSLIPFKRAEVVGGDSQGRDTWTTGMSFLAQGRGDAEDHALLLCGLLLGFGCVCAPERAG